MCTDMEEYADTCIPIWRSMRTIVYRYGGVCGHMCTDMKEYADTCVPSDPNMLYEGSI
jgi:hypothetical protein